MEPINKTIVDSKVKEEPESDYGSELADEVYDYFLMPCKSGKEQINEVRQYSITSDGICDDQENCWEGKMAAYRKHIANKDAPRIRSSLFTDTDEVLEKYWDEGLLPDGVSEDWVD